MSLFRRGTQLLRLGSGLRNCCCRPENPDVCFCPDWCRYYWYWPGTDLMPSHSLLSDGCANLQDDFFFSNDFFTVTSATSKYGFDGIRFGYVSQDFESAPSSIATQLFGPEDSSEYSPWGFVYSTEVFLFVHCESFNEVNIRPRFYFSATLKQKVVLIGVDPPGIGQSPSATLFQIERVAGRVGGSGGELPFTSNCHKNQSLWCLPFTGDVPTTEYGFAGFEFAFSESGVSGFEWGAFPQPDIDLGFTEWHKDDYPFPSFSVSLLSNSSCQPGACDCLADLTGRSVVFKGKTFTYGSLQQFTSDDASEFWEESPAGVFRKVTFDACDVSQQFIALQETAEIICSETIEEGQFWAVFFTVECRERDACGGAFDRLRTTIFNGIFTCNSEGFPSGTPTVELANDDLSDPPPTGDCAAFPLVPSIAFT